MAEPEGCARHGASRIPSPIPILLHMGTTPTGDRDPSLPRSHGHLHLVGSLDQLSRDSETARPPGGLADRVTTRLISAVSAPPRRALL